MILAKHLVEKPWGRTNIPAAFGDMGGKQIGEIWYEHEGLEPLPLLVKWLFTSEKLSIQVHPNDEQAQSRGHVSGKEECWYIVDADPGAVLGIGTRRALSANELRAASQSGDIEDIMDWRPVKAGDYFYIPAGTVHAIGAGITLVEVQQYADITYRLYDYGRPRELHLDDGVAVSEARPYDDKRSGHVTSNAQLVDGRYFRLWMVTDSDSVAKLPDDGDRWVVPISGDGVGNCMLVAAGEAITFESGSRLLVAMI